MDALCKCRFIIIETIVNSMKTRHVSKVIDVFSKNLFMSIRNMKKKEIPGSHYFSFFALSNLLTQTCLHFCRTGQLTSEHTKCTYPILFIIVFVCLFVHTYCI